jgi:membrane protease YdiL (CAAX protease family)
MTTTQSKPPEHSKPWQSKAWIQLLAVVIGVLPLYSSLIIFQLRRNEPFSIQVYIFYLAVIAPLAIVIAFLLLRFLCGENPRDLNLRPGKLSLDLLAMLILSLVILVASVISTHFLSELLPESASSTSDTDLFVALAANSGLLVLFAGPLFLLGAASEEVIRAFLLSRLWKVWPSPTGKWVAIVPVRPAPSLSGVSQRCVDGYLRPNRGALLSSIWPSCSVDPCALPYKCVSGGYICHVSLTGLTLRE